MTGGMQVISLTHIKYPLPGCAYAFSLVEMGITMKRIVLIALLYLLTGAFVYADDSSLTMERAKQGNRIAQTDLAFMYYGGEGVPQDYAEAVKWFRMAANQDFVLAQYGLGIMYDQGKGVPQDSAEAVKWFRVAANQDFVFAQYILGIMYNQGKGVSQDYAEAVKWYRKAAEQGYAKAQYNLGSKYYDGQGVPQDYAEAYVWESIAAASGHEDATFNRDITAKKLTPEALNAAQKRASKLFAEIQARKE